MPRLRYVDRLGLNKKTLTQRVIVGDDNGENNLGEVKWYAPWRRYCFFPNQCTLYDASCLQEIVSHLDDLMKQRKKDNA